MIKVPTQGAFGCNAQDEKMKMLLKESKPPWEERYMKPHVTLVDQCNVGKSPLAGKGVKIPTVESLWGNIYQHQETNNSL